MKSRKMRMRMRKKRQQLLRHKVKVLLYKHTCAFSNRKYHSSLCSITMSMSSFIRPGSIADGMQYPNQSGAMGHTGMPMVQGPLGSLKSLTSAFTANGLGNNLAGSWTDTNHQMNTPYVSTRLHLKCNSSRFDIFIHVCLCLSCLLL
jgi:hypothetical protein